MGLLERNAGGFPKKTLAPLALAAAVGLSATLVDQPAEACGGCFHEPTPPGEQETQVVGHRMIFSVSQTETTLWDQIEYTGDPTEFAWVLPIKGTVEVGLSSDVLFETLEDTTQVSIIAPPLNCPPPPVCPGMTSTGTSTGFATGTSTGTGTGVGVIAQETVGPYETVQLETTDPNALFGWLAMNQFVVSPDLTPVITAYVNEGFNFLAMKLAPGEGVDAMRPVRISTPGAGLSLPLRMVAAGTGASTTIRLWVLGEGRYEAQNFTNLRIDPDDVVWDFNISKSNYSDLVQAAYDSVQGDGWLTAASMSFSKSTLSAFVQNAVFSSPDNGYDNDDFDNAVLLMEADLAKLLAMSGNDARLTRMDAELPRTSLAKDLALTASIDQALISPLYTPDKSVNMTCPQFPPCPMDTQTSTLTGTGSGPFPMDNNDDPLGDGGDGGCTVGHVGGAPTGLALAGLGAMVALLRRRRR